jgi:hypothetical protein
MKVEDVIGQLLMRTNCVIVPDFGGFISNTKSAYIDYKKGVVYPPTKSVTFNRSLNNNDGLLVNEYGKINSKNYTASLEDVSCFVRESKQLLKQGERISFENVGFLYADANGNLQFEQDRFFNLLMEAYGMGSVQFIPEKTEVQEKKVVASAEKSGESITPIISLAGAKKSNPIIKVAKYAAAAALIPILFYSFWIPIHTDVLRSGILFKDDFNPLKEIAEAVYLKKEIGDTSIDNLESNEPTFSETINQLPASVSVFSFELTEDTYIPVKLEKTVLEKSSVASIGAHSTGKYHLIAGCFGNKSNAEKLVQQLTEQGLNAYIVDFHKGLHRVSADQSNTKNSLNISREKLSSNGFSSWILKK